MTACGAGTTGCRRNVAVTTKLFSGQNCFVPYFPRCLCSRSCQVSRNITNFAWLSLRFLLWPYNFCNYAYLQNWLSIHRHPFQLPEYATLLHKKSFIVRVLYKNVLLFGHWPIGFCVWLLFFYKRCFYMCVGVYYLLTYLLTYLRLHVYLRYFCMWPQWQISHWCLRLIGWSIKITECHHRAYDALSATYQLLRIFSMQW